MQLRTKKPFHLLLVCLALSLMVGCTASSSPTNGEELPTYQLEIDLLGTKDTFPLDSQGRLKTGVNLSSSDGEIIMSLNEGTILVDEDEKPLQFIQVTIDPSPPPPEGTYIVGAVYDFAPESASFIPSLKLTLGYDSNKLPEGLGEDDVYIACYENDKWEMLRYKEVEKEADQVTTQIDHLSKYAVLISSEQSTTISALANRVDVIYFHRTIRCHSCLYSEAQIRATLNEYFAEELESGRITFLSVDVQNKDNATIIEKYGAYGPQLFINVLKGDTESIEEVQEFWDFIDDDEGFSRLIIDKVNEALEGASL